jgi:hypothetical protein
MLQLGGQSTLPNLGSGRPALEHPALRGHVRWDSSLEAPTSTRPQIQPRQPGAACSLCHAKQPHQNHVSSTRARPCTAPEEQQSSRHRVAPAIWQQPRYTNSTGMLLAAAAGHGLP